jgi:fatty acid desaturase
LNDPRDLPFVRLLLGCLIVATSGFALIFSGAYFWWLVPVYFAVWGVGFLDRFILMLHCTSHRPLFKPRYRSLNLVIPWLVGPFFGETPESYFAHHMGMHHPENNLERDLSSTMRYRRDSFAGWLHYVGRFLTVGLVELTRYHRDHQNKKLMRRLLTGEIAFWTVVAVLTWLRPVETLVVLVLPVIVVRTLMMAGNWGQHAFVDASDPGNAYKNSISCINCRYNARCFNDGYHIHHHVRPRCHWSDYPAEFADNIARYAQEDAIVFDGIDFFGVWVALMLGRWNTLARAFVQLPGAPKRTHQEVVAFLKSRVAPIV